MHLLRTNVRRIKATYTAHWLISVNAVQLGLLQTFHISLANVLLKKEPGIGRSIFGVLEKLIIRHHDIQHSNKVGKGLMFIIALDHAKLGS